MDSVEYLSIPRYQITPSEAEFIPTPYCESQSFSTILQINLKAISG